MSTFASTIETMVKNLNEVISTKTVVGTPQQVGDATIIPMMDVSFGLAAGGNNKEKTVGTGGGLTGKMSPSAVLIIKDGHSKLLNVKNQDTLAKLVDLIPDICDKFSSKKAGMPSDQEVRDAAFPENEKNEI